MLIEIHGDVWLLSDIVCISLNEGDDDDDDWTVSLLLRGENVEDVHEYEMDSAEQARGTHFKLISEWKKWLMP